MMKDFIIYSFNSRLIDKDKLVRFGLKPRKQPQVNSKASRNNHTAENFDILNICKYLCEWATQNSFINLS